MTGPEHYHEAECLVESANDVGHEDPARGAGILAAAQVHATLALAAATAMGHYPYATTDGTVAAMPNEDWQAWDTVAGVRS